MIPVLTKIYAYLFEEGIGTDINIERFLTDNQSVLSLATKPNLLNEWKTLMKNAELKNSLKGYEGEQQR